MRLADCCASIDYGLTASGVESPIGPRLLRITDIVPGFVNWESVPFCDAPAGYQDRYGLAENDVVIARTGATTGVSYLVRQAVDAVFASYLVRLRMRPEYDARFISYWLKSSEFWGYLRGVLGDKSAQPNASATTLTNAPISRMPPLAEQRAIAEVLGVLDDKIEANRRMNATLEALARAMFKSWFVDFDPVRAKVEGREPTLAPDLAALFPDRLTEGPRGSMPEGWEFAELRNVFAKTNGEIRTGPFGSQLHQSDYKAEGTPVVMPANLIDGTIDETDIARIGAEDVERLSDHKLKVGDIVYGRRGDIGRKALTGDTEEGWLCGTGCLRIRSAAERCPPLYLFQYLGLDHVREWIATRAVGATMPNLNTGILGEVEVLLPSSEVANAFGAIAGPLDGAMRIRRRQSRTLAQLRDLLLPKLLSGTLRVRDAERMIGDAA